MLTWRAAAKLKPLVRDSNSIHVLISPLLTFGRFLYFCGDL